ncbi:MAG: hypothetical protein QM586_04875 [Xenophilus sp.]
MTEWHLGWLIAAALVIVLVLAVLRRARRGGRKLTMADLVRRRRELQQQLQELAGDAGPQLLQLEARRRGEASTSLAVLEAAVARAEKMQAHERGMATWR